MERTSEMMATKGGEACDTRAPTRLEKRARARAGRGGGCERATACERWRASDGEREPAVHAPAAWQSVCASASWHKKPDSRNRRHTTNGPDAIRRATAAPS
eukprot:4691537-Pleurochrysis_carterae.AAC.4